MGFCRFHIYIYMLTDFYRFPLDPPRLVPPNSTLGGGGGACPGIPPCATCFEGWWGGGGWREWWEVGCGGIGGAGVCKCGEDGGDGMGWVLRGGVVVLLSVFLLLPRVGVVAAW